MTKKGRNKPHKMVTIEILTDKIVMGTPYKSFNELCRDLVLYNGVPIGTEENRVGSRKRAILKELERYVETEPNPKINQNAIIIKGVFDPPRDKDETNIAEYMRPILKDMINKEFQDVCIVKYHKALTVDLNYMPSGYNELYKALHHKEFKRYKIQNTENYAKHIMNELVSKIKTHINYYSQNLNYNGVSYYKMPIDTVDFDFLPTADQELYDDCEIKAKSELKDNAAPNMRIDYRQIPTIASEKFNELKKSLNKPVKLIKANIFEIEHDNFKLMPQTINPTQLNCEIMKYLIRRRDVLFKYTQTDEYKQIEESFIIGTMADLCSDKAVRQALTIKNRDNTAKNKKIAEIEIPLDYSLRYVADYVRDVDIIISHCKI